MKNNILYRFLSALAALFCLCSCVLKETYIPENNGAVDVVFRPTSYYNQTVGTKSDGESTVFDVEDVIYSAFLIIFDNQGQCLLREPLTIIDNATISPKTLKVDRALNLASIYVVVNVPQSFVDEWTNDDDDNYTSDLNKFQNAEIDFSASGSPFSFAGLSGQTSFIGIPQVIINEEARQCFPMYGYVENCNLSTGGAVTIDIKRLFARIDLTMSLNIDEDNNLLTSKPKFTLQTCQIFNIPKKVSLLAPSMTSCAQLTDSQSSTLLASASISSFNLTNATAETQEDNILSNGAQGKKIYFYTPEHKLGVENDNNDPKLKPDILSGTSYRPLYASITGILVDGDGVSNNAEYNIYFGINSTNDFDICRNTKYNNLVNINGTDEKDADHRVSLEEIDGYIESLVSNGKTANCYIIGQTGTYLLPAYRGAFNDMDDADICDEGTDEVLVCDNPDIKIEILHDLCKQSTIALQISHSASAQNIVMTGNAVIARRSKRTGNIDWSWHLWFVPGLVYETDSDIINIGEVSIGGVYTNNMPGGTSPMMDRNLGSRSESSDVSSWIPGRVAGLYYRYGYKEPYLSGKNMSGENVPLAYQGSEVDCYAEWDSDEKAITDPCPIGYRVPSTTTWSGANYNDATKEHAPTYSAFRYWKNGGRYDANTFDDTYYPYVGWYNGTDHTTGVTGESIDSGDVRGTKKYPNNQDTQRVITRLPSDPPVRYSNIEYEVLDGQTKAHLLGSDGLLISYGYNEDGFVFTCIREVGVWKEVSYTSILGQRKYYIADYTTSNEGYSSDTLTGDEVKQINESHYNDLIDEINDDYNGWIGGIIDALTKTPFFKVGEEAAVAGNGYQVRCVEE